MTQLRKAPQDRCANDLLLDENPSRLPVQAASSPTRHTQHSRTMSMIRHKKSRKTKHNNASMLEVGGPMTRCKGVQRSNSMQHTTHSARAMRAQTPRAS